MNTLVNALTRRCVEAINERIARPAFAYCLTVAMLGAVPTALHAQIDVLTNRYDRGRSGAKLAEKSLTPTNINPNQFGNLYTYPVDGAVYAQPSYVAGVTINGAARNTSLAGIMVSHSATHSGFAVVISVSGSRDRWLSGRYVAVARLSSIAGRSHSRCQRTTVSGWTIIKALRQCRDVLARTTQNSHGAFHWNDEEPGNQRCIAAALNDVFNAIRAPRSPASAVHSQSTADATGN